MNQTKTRVQPSFWNISFVFLIVKTFKRSHENEEKILKTEINDFPEEAVFIGLYLMFYTDDGPLQKINFIIK